MKVGVLRAVTYAALVAAVILALRFAPQLPDRRPAEILQQAAMPSWALKRDTLARGETLIAVLRRGGLPDSSANGAMRATMAAGLNHRAIPANMTVEISRAHADSGPSVVKLRLSLDSTLVLKRVGEQWVGAMEMVTWTTDTIVVGGVVRSNLYQAMDEAASDFLPRDARNWLTGDVAEVYEYRVDMSRDLQKGDEFKVIAERMVNPDGVVKIGRVLATTFALSGQMIKAVRFASATVKGEFFDQDGKSMRAAFLQAPLDFRRISSSFGTRVHPILGDRRMHKGTDYAADAGTPVRAIGDGTVIRASWGNGYGNVVEIRHQNGLVTRYGHLRGFAKGVHPGIRVGIGQTIAYVGSTGLSTGPHLHFETIRNGTQVNPRVELKKTGGDPVPAAERVQFLALRDRMLAPLATFGTGASTLAQR